MSKHTPGPWHVSRDRDHVVIHCGDFDFLPANTRGAELEEWQANARLIAAAPDLLALLKAVRGYHNGGSMYAVETIDAAIAKAEGTS